VKKIDQVMNLVKEFINGDCNLEIKDPTNGGLPMNAEGRCFCFTSGKKNYKLVIWDISQ
jgi:hypothetical protein